MSLLSENLRFLRYQLGLSQRQVAEDLVITRGRYSKYEEGSSEPPIAILLRISKYFEVRVDLLIASNLRVEHSDKIGFLCIENKKAGNYPA